MIKDYYIRTNTYAELEETLLSVDFTKDVHGRFIPPRNSMTVHIIGDLPKQNPDGSIVTTQKTIDDEVVNVPVMQNKYHANIRCKGVLFNLINQIYPKYPLRKYL